MLVIGGGVPEDFKLSSDSGLILGGRVIGGGSPRPKKQYGKFAIVFILRASLMNPDEMDGFDVIFVISTWRR